MEPQGTIANSSSNRSRRGTNRRDGGGQINSGGIEQKWIPSESSSGNSSSVAAGVNKGRHGSGKAVNEIDGKSSSGPPSVSYDNSRAWSKVHDLHAKPNLVQDTKTKSTSKFSLGLGGGSSGAATAQQSFIAYLPQDEADIDVSETQEVVDLLNEQLSVLLRLPSQQFWRKVVTDESLSVFVDSYLQYRKRWFDTPTGNWSESKVSIVVGDGDLCRRAFMLLLRMSSNGDPGAPTSETLSSKEHAAILKERKLLDVPKLMDVCAIYGHDNPDLTRRLVNNVFTAQPGYADDMAGYVPPLLQRISIMHKRCCDTVQMIAMHQRCSDTGQALTVPGDPGTFVGADRVHQEILEIVDYLNDVVFTLNAFILVYPPAASILMTSGNSNSGHGLLLSALAAIHDTLVPNLEEGFAVLASKESQGNEETAASAQVRLNSLNKRLVDVVWLLIENRYLGGSSGKDTSIAPTADNDFDEIIAKGDSMVQDIVALAMGPSDDAITESISRLVCTGSLLKSLERKHGLLYQIQQACQRGVLVLDDAQQDYISAVVVDGQAAVGGRGEGHIESRHDDVPRRDVTEREGDEEAVIRQSKISQIKDLFPNFGDGFIDACLEVYDNDPEIVIQRILEGTLHPDLVSLDISLAAKPERVVKPPPAKDKGKGKVYEMSETEGARKDKSIPLVGASSTLSLGGSSSSAASHGKTPVPDTTISVENSGRYMRRQRGGDESFNELLDSRSSKEDLQRAIKAAAARIEYEDEYDDSFDELGQYVTDAGGIEETEILADLVGSRGGGRSNNLQSRSSGRPSPVMPWGASSARDRQSSGDGPSGRGEFQRGERQHPAKAPPSTAEYQRGERGRREQLEGAVKGGSEPSGVRHYSGNIPRSNVEAQGGERRYSAGASNGNAEGQRGDRTYSAGAHRSDGQRGDRQFRPVNDLEAQKRDGPNLGGSSRSPSGTAGYQFGSPSAESEGQANETQGNLPAVRGRGGRGNRGRGKIRGPQPKSDFYLKDGKLYSYKVAGAIGVGSVDEAEVIKREERETIYGLGEGGNVPRPQDGSEIPGKQDGRDNANNNNSRGEGGRGRDGYGRGRGDLAGRGRGRGGNDNHHRKEKATQKHFTGLSGY